MSKQFGRYANLILSKGPKGLDISNLRFTFKTTNNDTETPNTATIRVYNAAEQTLNKQAFKEFDTVTLEAGYQDNHAIIFRGNIKQVRRGKENNVDSFVEIDAADNDIGYNFGIVNKTFAPGTTPVQEVKAYADAMGVTVDDSANQFLKATGGILPNPRGKVAYGMARSFLRDLSYTLGARWSVHDGVLYIIPLAGYLAGDAVRINSITGMVGVPEATDGGINVRTLLNPRIKIGRAIQLNNKDITQSDISGAIFPGYKATFVANTSHDGVYRVMVAEHTGDTRGDAWYTDIICLDIDVSASPQQSVAPF